jgi:hypothetical protein
MHRQNSLRGLPAGREDSTAAPERRLSWRTRRRRNQGNARRAPGTDPAGGQGAAMPAAPPAWAADTLPPPGAEGLADLMAGLNVISVLLLHELHEATEEPPPAILQRLALLAENRRRPPSE